MVQRTFKGLIPATHTPMQADGSLDLDAVPGQATFLLDAGVDALFVCGTTGEFPSLTVAERQQVTEAFITAVEGRIPVIVHVGHACLKDARALASHAAARGAAAIAAAPPAYFKPATVKTVLDCCMEIATGAPDLPFFYYHIPSLTGVHLSMTDFLQKGAERFPNLAGIKYSCETLDEFSACLDRFGERYTLMFGRDQMLLAALAVGAPAAVGSTYNYAAPLYQALWRAYADGDISTARRCQYRAVRFIELLERYGGVRASKTFMKLVGADCGPPRLPLQPCSPEEESALRSSLEQIGFFQWRKG
jgi:N-acetylneuraminate lyase